MPVSYEDVAAAARRLAGHAHRTPIMTSRQVDERTGCRVFFKCENFQRVGAFKFRGAYNAISQLDAEQTQTRCARLLLGQPRPGGRAGGQAARHRRP